MKKKISLLWPLTVILFSCSRSEEPKIPEICNALTDLASSPVTVSGSTFSWSAVYGSTPYGADYKTSASSAWTNAASATTFSSANLSGLSSSTAYGRRVKTNCTLGSSGYPSPEYTTITGGPLVGIASKYPGDVNIQNDPNVLYVEKFDDGMTNILSRYNDIQNSAGMSLDTDIPPGSLEPNSIKMSSIKGVSVGGHLFKNFGSGFDSTVYIRYYVKYPSISKGYFHHEGVWFGGYNPAIDYPFPRAGTCGSGGSRLSITYENVWKGNLPGMDTYLYWGDMQSYDGGATCYGNTMITEGRTNHGNPISTTAPVNVLDKWMCVEVMIKLNNPVVAYNGELAVWQNGVQVGYWGPGFPNGHWQKDKWYNNPADPPFQGFRWRTDPNLNINWLWFEFYHDNPNAPSSYIKFDHLVIATKYIGPIKLKQKNMN